jgi:ABC-2 type transport system ATP-binding protein
VDPRIAKAAKVGKELGLAMKQDASPTHLSDAMVETRALTKRYGKRTAVETLNLRIARGEIYGFLGPNGAGKTTTLRMLAGLARPTSGSALVAGSPPGSSASLARIGCLIENPAFYPYLSGRENLAVVAGWAGCSAARVEDVLDLVDLASRAGDRFSTYSLGMRQRLGVAAALLKEPDLLILDEPTNGLDPQGMVEMRNLIKVLGETSHTVLVSSHLLAEVEHMCTRVGVIKEGRLIAEGTVASLRGDACTIVVRATPDLKAAELLTQMLGEAAVARKDGLIHISVPVSKAAGINRQLVLAGIEVSDFHPVERSLEEAFLEMTGAPGYQ